MLHKDFIIAFHAILTTQANFCPHLQIENCYYHDFHLIISFFSSLFPQTFYLWGFNIGFIGFMSNV